MQPQAHRFLTAFHVGFLAFAKLDIVRCYYPDYQDSRL